MIYFNTLILALSSSIDSFGIGITYGLRKIKLHFSSKLILFLTSIIINLFAGLFGIVLKSILPNFITEFFGCLILICMGLFILIKTYNKEYSFDFDNSKDINKREAIALGIALSLDSLCIVIGISAIGINIFIFLLLVVLLQYLFLNFGLLIGLNLYNCNFISQKSCTKASGFLLILIGILKLFF